MACWILDLHDDFPSSRALLPFLQEPVVLQREEVLKGRWPEVEGRVVGYGTMFTMTRLRRHHSLGRAVFDDYGLLRCSSYYRWTYDLLKRTSLLVPLGAVTSLPLELCLTAVEFFCAATRTTSCIPRPSILSVNCQISSNATQTIGTNWRCYRCFCRQGRYFCGSSYPQPPYLEGRLLQQGLTMASIDLAECRDGHLRLVEVGGVNSWGLYGSDPQAFIAALEAQADEEQ